MYVSTTCMRFVLIYLRLGDKMIWIWPITFCIAVLGWGIYWSIPHGK